MELDLNLLRVFDTLADLQSVTHTADRLSVTQSAVSHALGRLREAIGDPLFVRGARGLEPTERAIEMAPAIREGLMKLRAAVSPSRFDEARSTRCFTVAASAYLCAFVIPALVERARQTAPSISFQVAPIGENLVSDLQRGRVDLALGSFPHPPRHFSCDTLFDDEMVWIAAVDSTLASMPFDPDRVARQPKVAIARRRLSNGADGVDDYDTLSMAFASPQSNLGTESGMTVYDSQTAVAVVARSDLVALVPRRMAEHDPRKVAILGPSSTRATVSIAMMWHRRLDEDAGFSWLRQILYDATRA